MTVVLLPERKGSCRNQSPWRRRLGPQRKPGPVFLRRWPLAFRKLAHEPHQIPLPLRDPPSGAAEHCRPEISSGLRKGQFALHCAGCGKSQALANIFLLKVRIFRKYLVLRQTAGQHSQDGSHGYTQMANAWYAAHLGGIDGNALKVFQCVPVTIVAAAGTPKPSGGRNSPCGREP